MLRAAVLAVADIQAWAADPAVADIRAADRGSLVVGLRIVAEQPVVDQEAVVVLLEILLLPADPDNQRQDNRLAGEHHRVLLVGVVIQAVLGVVGPVVAAGPVAIEGGIPVAVVAAVPVAVVAVDPAGVLVVVQVAVVAGVPVV